MIEIDPRLRQASAAREAGRHEEALDLVRAVFADVDGATVPDHANPFMTMFLWQMLAHEYAPARAALAHTRDAQARRLLAGERLFGAPVAPGDHAPQRSRFALVVEMNEILADPAATHALFCALVDTDPGLARSHAWLALPAIVAVGDFALAERYRGDPLALLEPLTLNARTLPLLPPPGAAPRVAAELMNLVRDVRIGIAVLDGLGRADEARALRAALLDGLESEALRALALRELAAPGSINDAVVAHQMAQQGIPG